MDYLGLSQHAEFVLFSFVPVVLYFAAHCLGIGSFEL